MSQTEYTEDSIGRKFCKEHHQEICLDCREEFDIPNRVQEEDAGLIRKASEVETAAQKYAITEHGLDNLDSCGLSASGEGALKEALEETRKCAEDELGRLARGNDVESAKRASQELQNRLMNRRAFMQARALYPILEGESREAHKRKVCWSVASPPPINSDRADLYTCAYCKKISTVRLTCCGRCKKSSYRSRACQKVCWKVHKKECISSDNTAKSLPLTWAQLEAHQGRPVEGETLQVRAMVDVSTMRQVYICKDRVGDVMQVAAYTNSRSVHPADLKHGSIIKWKNPRFHYFKDRSTGARIEEEDLVNITVTN